MSDDSSTMILRANLKALGKTEPQLARRIENTAAASLTWTTSKKGPLTATYEYEGRKLSLASRYDPDAEARKLIASVDPSRHAAVVFLGMGLGYQVMKLIEKMGQSPCLIIICEPNLSLLRAVLERVDHSVWLCCANVILTDGTLDRGALLGRIETFGCLMTQGTTILTHPVSRQISGEALKQFGQMVTDALAFFRTHVATALVNASRTIRNNCMNLGFYAAGATTNELEQAAKGYPAVCVGAGPSLAGNIDQLCDPQVREKIVLITAQTTLKPLLDRGIEPDFVTALDYHEISGRFYENLPPMKRVTLVAEPKSHRSILEGFPGPIRMTSNQFLDRMLGQLARPITPIPSGATVAHLSFYLAQHLGCDPIMLVGQDLGFSNGLYYCPGTAIHDVWAPELGPFNTLEMMEWQRIVRHRHHLQRLEDVNHQPIFTDEQMFTYLKQFERDFAKASQTVIDCTQGGLPKEHTLRMTLSEALADYAIHPVPPLPLPPEGLNAARLEQVIELLNRRLTEVAELLRLSHQTVPLLKQMKKHQRHYDRACRLHDQIEKNKKQVDLLQETFGLVNDLNTVGAFNRARADRAIHHESQDDPFEIQKHQIERDLDNLQWLIQACEEARTIFQDALQRVREQARTTGQTPNACPVA